MHANVERFVVMVIHTSGRIRGDILCMTPDFEFALNTAKGVVGYNYKLDHQKGTETRVTIYRMRDNEIISQTLWFNKPIVVRLKINYDGTFRERWSSREMELHKKYGEAVIH